VSRGTAFARPSDWAPPRPTLAATIGRPMAPAVSRVLNACSSPLTFELPSCRADGPWKSTLRARAPMTSAELARVTAPSEPDYEFDENHWFAPDRACSAPSDGAPDERARVIPDYCTVSRFQTHVLHDGPFPSDGDASRNAILPGRGVCRSISETEHSACLAFGV